MRRAILIIILTIFLLAVASLIGFSALFLTMVRVPTGAMANTIIPGDCLVVRKRDFGPINRGDLIIFRYPKDPSVHYLFRVVGLPGETIEIKDRIILINGKELPERRVTVKPEDGRFTVLSELSSEGTGPYTVFYSPRAEGDGVLDEYEGYGTPWPFRIPDNQYFVMGDNRNNSQDSRFWGALPREGIVGKPTMIYWSSQIDQSGNEQARWERIGSWVR